MLAPLATSLNLALVGTPNSGKTSLFNALTGSRQRAANYPGVTVERKSGTIQTAAGRTVTILSIYPALTRCADEAPTKRSPAKSYSVNSRARRRRTVSFASPTRPICG